MFVDFYSHNDHLKRCVGCRILNSLYDALRDPPQDEFDGHKQTPREIKLNFEHKLILWVDARQSRDGISNAERTNVLNRLYNSPTWTKPINLSQKATQKQQPSSSPAGQSKARTAGHHDHDHAFTL
ncbi:MAG: hypothetical protein M1831_001019 [Alyxoria varia]|nr:MAG: hypothetical protein M1831_001019 [Alyxoria varia]